MLKLTDGTRVRLAGGFFPNGLRPRPGSSVMLNVGSKGTVLRETGQYDNSHTGSSTINYEVIFDAAPEEPVHLASLYLIPLSILEQLAECADG